MSYFLIFILLISINCQEIPEKWEIDKLWKFVNEEISKREYNSSGLIDPNKYIHNETFEEFEDYLKSLNEQFGVCIFFTVIKQFDINNVTDKFLNESSLELFHYFEKSNFDIKPSQLISVIYSVEDKKYKIEMGNDYSKHKSNNKSISEIFEDVEPYLEDKKVFVILISIAFKVENIRHPTLEDDEEEEEKGKEKEIKKNPKKKKQQKSQIKYNNSSNIFSLYLILIILVILFIMVGFLIRRLSKRLKKLKSLDEKSINYNVINNLNEK